MAALERFKAMESNIMPREAINQFVEANQSDAQTPVLFFGNDEDTEARRSRERRKIGDETSLSSHVKNSNFFSLLLSCSYSKGPIKENVAR